MQATQHYTVTNSLISAGCNVEYEVMGWHESRFIVYGASNNLKVWDTLQGRILASLNGHKGRVNCVQFLKDGRIVSVCAEGTLIVWGNDSLTSNWSNLPLDQLEEKSRNWIIQAIYTLPKKLNIKSMSILEEQGQSIEPKSLKICLLTTKSDLHILDFFMSQKSKENKPDQETSSSNKAEWSFKEL